MSLNQQSMGFALIGCSLVTGIYGACLPSVSELYKDSPQDNGHSRGYLNANIGALVFAYGIFLVDRPAGFVVLLYAAGLSYATHSAMNSDGDWFGVA